MRDPGLDPRRRQRHRWPHAEPGKALAPVRAACPRMEGHPAARGNPQDQTFAATVPDLQPAALGRAKGADQRLGEFAAHRLLLVQIRLLLALVTTW